MAYTLVLVLSLVVSQAAALKCTTGARIEDPQGNVLTAGATMECIGNQPQCVAVALGVALQAPYSYRLFFCASLEASVMTNYDFDRTCFSMQNRQDGHCYCNNADNCNSSPYGYQALPATETSSYRQCYTGAVTDQSHYMLGDTEPCSGLCVSFVYNLTYSSGLNYRRVYGCVARETRVQLGASSDNSCVTQKELTACFCTSDLCNQPVVLPPTPTATISCYTGYRYNNLFYGSVQQCNPGEVCMGLRYYSSYGEIHKCTTVDGCLVAQTQVLTNFTDCVFNANGYLQAPCCCTTDKCNFVPAFYPIGGVPTPDPTTNNNHLQCFDGFQLGNKTAVGQGRICSGACFYLQTSSQTTFGTSWTIQVWGCIDTSVCTSHNIPMNSCKNVDYFNNFCCYASDTWTAGPITGQPVTTPSTPASIGTGPTSGPKTCPEGWIKSVLFDKCYYNRTEGAVNWFEAYGRCLSLHPDASLLSIKNSFENSQVSLLLEVDSYWIGIETATGDWQWADGQPITYTNWGVGEPNNDNGCARLQVADKKWFSDDCDRRYPAPCEIFLA